MLTAAKWRILSGCFVGTTAFIASATTYQAAVPTGAPGVMMRPTACITGIGSWLISSAGRIQFDHKACWGCLGVMLRLGLQRHPMYRFFASSLAVFVVQFTLTLRTDAALTRSAYEDSVTLGWGLWSCGGDCTCPRV